MTQASVIPPVEAHTQRIYDREQSIDKLIGRRLAAIREQAMMTIEELSVLTGLPADCLSEHENAEVPLPLNRIRRIAIALDTDAVSLMSRLLFPGR